MTDNKKELIARFSQLQDYWSGSLPSGFSSDDFNKINAVNRLFIAADQLAYKTSDDSEKTCQQLSRLIAQIDAKLGYPKLAVVKPPKLAMM